MTIGLDTIGSDVVKQRGAMNRRVETADAIGPCVNKRSIASKRALETCELPIDHSFGGSLEFEDRTFLRDGFDVGRKRGPVEEIIVTGDRKPGIIERELGVADFGIGNEFRAPLDLLVEKPGVLPVEETNGSGLGSTVGLEQVFCLSLVGAE